MWCFLHLCAFLLTLGWPSSSAWAGVAEGWVGALVGRAPRRGARHRLVAPRARLWATRLPCEGEASPEPGDGAVAKRPGGCGERRRRGGEPAGSPAGRAGGQAGERRPPAASGAGRVRPTGSGLSRGYYGMARPGEGGGKGGRAASIMGWRGLLRRGRASRDYYGMARPPATGGGQVGGRGVLWDARPSLPPPAAGGVLWDEDAPVRRGGGGGGYYGMAGPRRSRREGGEGSIMGWHHFPSACDRATYYGMPLYLRREILWDAARGGGWGGCGVCYYGMPVQPGAGGSCRPVPVGKHHHPPTHTSAARPPPPAGAPVPPAPGPPRPVSSLPPSLSAVITNKAARVLWDVCSTVWGVGWLLWSVSRGWLLWDGVAFVNYYGMRPARRGGVGAGREPCGPSPLGAEGRGWGGMGGLHIRHRRWGPRLPTWRGSGRKPRPGPRGW